MLLIPTLGSRGRGIMNCRLAWATWRDPVSKKKKKVMVANTIKTLRRSSVKLPFNLLGEKNPQNSHICYQNWELIE
jgi:hypothetical protein